MSEKPLVRFSLCVNGKLIKPLDFKQPSAESLVQVAKAEQGNSEVSCVIDQSIRMGQTTESRPSADTFANMVVQTHEENSPVDAKIPDELKTIGTHLWLANMEVSAQSLVLKPLSENPPNPNRLTPMTKAQLLDAQTQIETSCKDKHLTRMLKGVVTNMHCLMTLSREAGFIPLFGSCSLHLRVLPAQEFTYFRLLVDCGLNSCSACTSS